MVYLYTDKKWKSEITAPVAVYKSKVYKYNYRKLEFNIFLKQRSVLQCFIVNFTAICVTHNRIHCTGLGSNEMFMYLYRVQGIVWFIWVFSNTIKFFWFFESIFCCKHVQIFILRFFLYTFCRIVSGTVCNAHFGLKKITELLWYFFFCFCWFTYKMRHFWNRL